MNKLQEEIYSQSVPRVVSRFVKPRAVRFQRCRSHRKSPWRLLFFFCDRGSTHRLAIFHLFLAICSFPGLGDPTDRCVRPFLNLLAPGLHTSSHPPATQRVSHSTRQDGAGRPPPTPPPTPRRSVGSSQHSSTSSSSCYTSTPAPIPFHRHGLFQQALSNFPGSHHAYANPLPAPAPTPLHRGTTRLDVKHELAHPEPGKC